MKKQLLVLMMLLACTVMVVQAQSYKSLWAKVEECQKKDLPQSVVDSALRIYKKASKERNAPQMMKAYLTMMDARARIAPDSLEVDMGALKQWAETETDSVHAAVLCSVLGELCMRDNPKEAVAYIGRSVSPREKLELCEAGQYVPMVSLGESSARFEDNRMYPVLMRRAISLLRQNRWMLQSGTEINSTVTENGLYESLFAYFLRRGEREAYLLLKLEQIENQTTQQTDNEVIRTCRQLIDQYGEVDVCAEVYVELAQRLNSVSKAEEAYDTLRAGIKRYANYERINRLKTALAKQTTPFIRLQIGNLYPGKVEQTKVSYRNLKGLELKIYRTDVDDIAKIAMYDEQREDTFWQDKWYLYQTERYTLHSVPYTSKDTTLSVMIPEEGYYRFEIQPLADSSDEHKLEYRLVYVSALGIIASSRFENARQAMVIDRMTGAPVGGGEARFYQKENGAYVQKSVSKVDKDGIFSDGMSQRENLYRRMYVQVVTPEHSCMPLFYYGDADRKTSSRRNLKNLSLYTDRELYRPGQVVYVSGIAYSQKGDSVYTNKNEEVVLALRDANYKEIAKATLQTNEFGSFHTQFTLPSVCLPGSFSLSATNGKNNREEISIKVEEYKQPSFEVNCKKVKVAYTFGDTVWIEGNAKLFTGVPVQDAEVRYKIKKADSYYRISMGGRVLQQDVVRTDSAGNFRFPLVIARQAESDILSNRYQYYTYDVDVVSPAGDTQHCEGRLQVRKKAYRIAYDMKSNDWIKEYPEPLTLSVLNGNGDKLDEILSFEVVELLLNAETGKKQAGRIRCSSQIKTPQSFVPKEIYALPSGNYRLRMKAGSIGREVADSTDIVLFSLEDKKLPAGKDLFLYVDKTKSDKAEPTIYIGTSRKDVHLFCTMYVPGERLHPLYLPISDTLCVFPLKPNGKSMEALNVAYVKDDELYGAGVNIPKPVPNKNLNWNWQTFRDKLQAGEKEEWRLKIMDADGKPVHAELLATLYDASLDRLVSRNAWSVPLSLGTSIPYLGNRWLVGGSYSYQYSYPYPFLTVKDWAYTNLDIPFSRYYGSIRMLKSSVMMANVSVQGLSVEEDAVYSVAQSKEVGKEPRSRGMNAPEEAVEEASASGLAEENSDSDEALRQDFAETAFFYPQLRTNARGEVDLVFTLPESLTTWRFMGLAHTQSMEYAVIDTTAIARKEFMLQASLPRFVRVGDQTSLAATLSNLTGKSLRCTVRLELFDPLTEKVFHSAKQAVRVEAGRTATVSFSYEIPATYKIMACRMIADGGTFSDGEQHLLPVLDNKEPITESVAISVNKAGEKQYNLSELFNHQSTTATNRRMTVEFTGNPSWLAIMALPSVGQPSDKNAISLAAAYYSASLASWIVEQHPRIRTMFEAWKTDGGSKETFLSELQKDEELKELLLEYSPFLTEAENEAEQRRSLAALFDLNTLQGKKEVYLNRLQALQTEDGGWSWYEGMRPNRYMTQVIVETLLRLKQLTNESQKETTEMCAKGLAYLDNQAIEEYKRLTEKTELHPDVLSEFASHYLYICMLADRPLEDEALKAYNYFFDKLKEQSPRMTIYGKAIAAMVLANGGEQAISNDFVKSLLEYSVYTPEMGRYYDTNIALYSWADYRIPTQAIVVEALHRLGASKETITQMQQWLLKQKQVQSWDTPINTVNAVYALLLENESILAEQPMPELLLDNQPIDFESSSLGLNAVKKRFSLPEGEQAPETLTVRKANDGIAWGAVYAQYMEEMDKLSESAEGLSITRTFYVERLSGGASQWVKLEDGMTLKKGDKVKSSLRLKADRDMDFVQIKENRAACMEPASVLSGYRWGVGVGYYQAIKDASMEYYMDRLNKGTCTIESIYYITREGVYEAGSVKIQSAYAPEFNAHTTGQTLKVID